MTMMTAHQMTKMAHLKLPPRPPLLLRAVARSAVRSLRSSLPRLPFQRWSQALRLRTRAAIRITACSLTHPSPPRPRANPPRLPPPLLHLRRLRSLLTPSTVWRKRARQLPQLPLPRLPPDLSPASALMRTMTGARIRRTTKIPTMMTALAAVALRLWLPSCSEPWAPRDHFQPPETSRCLTLSARPWVATLRLRSLLPRRLCQPPVLLLPRQARHLRLLRPLLRPLLRHRCRHRPHRVVRRRLLLPLQAWELPRHHLPHHRRVTHRQAPQQADDPRVCSGRSNLARR